MQRQGKRKTTVRHDRSVGIVVYRDTPEGRKYLIMLKKRSTDFPKGHVEKGETDEQAALRETREETGIDQVELRGPLGATHYTLRKKGEVTRKTVAFFLGRTAQETVTISHEHKGFLWLAPNEAIGRLSFENQRRLVRKAEELLS